MSDADSPVHSRSGADVRWSRANFAEAIQGVQTPLSWTFWDHVMEICIRRSFGNIGALPASEVPPPSNPEAKVAAVFFGLPAGNVDVFHRIGEAMPGTSGAAVVEHLFGERRTASAAAGRGWLRYPIVAGKLPVAAVRSARSLPQLNTELRQWWRQSVIDSPPREVESATLLLRSSAEAFIRVGVQHATVSMIGQSIAEQIEALAITAWGSRDEAATLMTGYGAMEETELMGDVWALAHDELGIDEFLARHGYHGPDEGNLASTVWREDAGPVKRLAERYRTAGVAHPRARKALRWSVDWRPSSACCAACRAPPGPRRG